MIKIRNYKILRVIDKKRRHSQFLSRKSVSRLNTIRGERQKRKIEDIDTSRDFKGKSRAS